MPIPEAAGGHAGGDEPLLDSLFGRDGAADPLGQRADYTDGLASVAIGLAANESMATGQVIDVSQFGLELSRAPAANLLASSLTGRHVGNAGWSSSGGETHGPNRRRGRPPGSRSRVVAAITLTAAAGGA